MPIGGKQLTSDEAKRLQALLGPHTFHILVQQPTWNGIPLLNPAQFPLANNKPMPPAGGAANMAAGKTPPAASERRTPIVTDGKKLKMEDWFAPIEKSMKDARENLNLVAEEMVRLAAAGKTSADTFDQQRKALEYLGGQGKKNEELDKKLSKNALAVRDAFNGVQKSMLITSATLTATYASLHHLAGAANPGLLKAWDGSMQLLQARIGGALLPAMDAIIDGLMDMADWFEGLSEGSKKIVAGGVLAVPLLVGLASAIRELTPAGELAIAIFKKFVDAARARSAVATGGIAGGAALAAAAAFWQMDRKAGPSSEEARGVGQNTGSVTVEEMRALRFTEDQIRMLTSGDKGQMQTARDAIIRQDWRRTEWQHFFHPEAAEDQRRAVQSVLDRIEQPGAGAVSKEETDWRHQVKRQAMRVSAVKQEAQPRYSPLDQARQSLQLQILGKNQFEQQLLKEQRKHREEEIKRLDDLIRQGNDKKFRIWGD